MRKRYFSPEHIMAKLGGLGVNQAKRLKGLERENARLRRLVADLSLEKQVLKDICVGNLVSPERRRQDRLPVGTP